MMQDKLLMDRYNKIYQQNRKIPKNSYSQNSLQLPRIEKSKFLDSLDNHIYQNAANPYHKIQDNQQRSNMSKSVIVEQEPYQSLKFLNARKYVDDQVRRYGYFYILIIIKTIKTKFSQYQLPKLSMNQKTLQHQQKPNSKSRNKININNENYHQSLFEQPTSLAISTFGASTMAGMMGNGMNKINQDSVIIDPAYGIYAVADGHGHGGERVSGYLRQTVTSNLFLEFLICYKIFLITETLQNVLPQTSVPFTVIREAFVKTFRQINFELFNSKFDCSLAGSTLSLVFFQGGKIYTANVGDSRAVLGKKIESEGWRNIELTRDQKPSVEDEARRIVQSGGRVAHQIDHQGNPVGPLRVWMKTVQAPGLAMTRSFGDKVGAQAGVIAIPGILINQKNVFFLEVLEFNISSQDKFVIVASDGIWEYMSNNDVVNFIGQSLDRGLNAQQISDKLVMKAAEVWKSRSLQRDDISCILVLLG